MERTLVKFLLIGLCVSGVLSRHTNVKNTNGTAQMRVSAPNSTNNQSIYTKVKSAPCRYNDPHVAECIRDVTEKARFLLAAGVPDVGIQPLEPLKIPSLRMRQHSAPQSGFKYDAWLSDVTLSGLTNFSFNSLDVYPDEMKVEANVSLPFLRMTGEYVIIGEFQMLPVESVGNMSANFSICTAKLVAVSARVDQRLVVKDANVRLLCDGQTKADLDDAHSSSHDMEMITNHIVTMHAVDITREFEPAVETSLAMVLEDVANKFLRNVVADEVLSG